MFNVIIDRVCVLKRGAMNMITASNISLLFSDKKLFEDINVKFTEGNCYGVIGANGAGKSTFLKILSGEVDSTSGSIILEKGKRLAFLRQDHFAYDDKTVLETVIMGHQELYNIMKKKEEVYARENFSDADGLEVGELEEQFAEMDGWSADSDAAMLLEGLGVGVDKHELKMEQLRAADKVKVLLAQALFGNPDVLLLDEPTNNLDLRAIRWLENFLLDFENTVIVVSHDRHFLNKVCTHILDIDFQAATLYVGNYDFWYQSSQLAQKMLSDTNKKKEEKMKELQDFIARFSANASKSKQATSRKKMLEKITLEDIKPSSRRYPFIQFTMERDLGKEVLKVENLHYISGKNTLLNNVNFEILNGDVVAFVSDNDLALTTLFQILADEVNPTSGTVSWGMTTKVGYMPKDYSEFFNDSKLNLVEWLSQFSPQDQSEAFLRSFLGRMLFSGEEALKKVSVLSGGEKMRCMFSKMMLQTGNVLLLDDPTNHLDLESITALDEGLQKFGGSILFTSHDIQFIRSLATRIIEIQADGTMKNYDMGYDEYEQLIGLS